MFDRVYTDLSLEKSADDYTPELGQEVTWTLTVSNEGPAWAENVQVKDMLPEGMEFVSSTESAGSFNSSDGTWSLGGLNVGDVATATVTMVVTDVDNYINNYAKVTTDTYDWNGYNDKDVIAVDPWQPTSADLSLVKTVSNPEPEVGSVVEWTVTVTNSGPDTAWRTTVKEALPEGLSFVGARASSGTYDFESGVWSVGDLESGETAEIVISTAVDSAVGTEYVNMAVAASNTADLDDSNNTAEASITVGAAEVMEPEPVKPEPEKPEGDKPGMDGRPHGGHSVDCYCVCQDDTGADLQVVKLVSDATPNLNSEVIWTLVVTNNGPEDAINVIVNDNLPAGVEYVSDSTNTGSFDIASGVWEIGDLPVGESVMLQITSVATDAAAVQTNIALVSSDTEDSNPANDVAVESIDAVNADLSVIKTPDEQAPDLGAEFDWTITVVNNGPDTAEDVIVDDLLPPDTVFVRSDDSRFVLSDDGTNGSIALGDLDSGEEFSFTITAVVNDANGPRTNVAEVSSVTYDDNPDNNRDEAEVDAVAADLQLVKDVILVPDPTGVVAEWQVSVTNMGPDAATGVVVEDVLPTGVSFLSADGSASNPDFDDESGLWTVGDLPVNETATIFIRTIVDDPGVLTNVAQVVASDQVDPDSAVDNDDGDQSEDDEDSATLEVIDLELTQEISSSTADVGGTVTFTITVTNESTVPASGVSVATQLPDHFASETLTFVDSSDEGIDDDPSSSWIIGDLAPEETVTLTVDAIVNVSGEIENIAQVFTADQEDVDSTPANGIEAEDDQQTVSLTVLEPGPDAQPDSFSVQPVNLPSNAIIMVDHSGSMGGVDTLDQNPSSLTADVEGLNGEQTSRLQIVREVVEGFSLLPQVGNVKVLGFDGLANPLSLDIPAPLDPNYESMPHDNVSPWFDTSGDTANEGLVDFLGALRASGFTNYAAALELSEASIDVDADGNDDLEPEGLTNYYFLTDGVPLSADSSSPTPDGDGLAEWESFVDARINEAYGIGFDGATDTANLPNLDIVSHGDDADETRAIDGTVRNEENTIIASSVTDLPVELFKLVSEQISGNVFADDDIGAAELQNSDMAITSITVAGTVFDSGSFSGFLPAGGFLEFDFSDGSFNYFAPAVDALTFETFDYTITDSNDVSDTATVTIDVLPPTLNNSPDSITDPAVSLLSDDELFASATMGMVNLPDPEANEWAGDSTSYDANMYDMMALVV